MGVRELNQSLSILHTEPHPITMILYYVSLDISYLFVIFTFLQSIKEVEHMKKRAEVENLKNLLVAGKTASPPVPFESTPIRPTTSSHWNHHHIHQHLHSHPRSHYYGTVCQHLHHVPKCIIRNAMHVGSLKEN